MNNTYEDCGSYYFYRQKQTAQLVRANLWTEFDRALKSFFVEDKPEKNHFKLIAGMI